MKDISFITFHKPDEEEYDPNENLYSVRSKQALV